MWAVLIHSMRTVQTPPMKLFFMRVQDVSFVFPPSYHPGVIDKRSNYLTRLVNKRREELFNLNHAKSQAPKMSSMYLKTRNFPCDMVWYQSV